MTRRTGFTVIELITVIVVGGIIATIAIKAFGSVSRRFSVREGVRVFSTMHARTRAQAVEFGQTVEFHVDLDGDSIWIARNDTTLEMIRIGSEFDLEMSGAGSQYTLCMNSRGFGGEGCNSFTGSVEISFANGADSTSVTMLPLGQLVN